MRVGRRTLHVACLLAMLPCGLGAQQRWTLEETLRIGGPDEGPYLFSDIRGVAVNARGEIFVLDFKVQEIRMFDAQGKFMKRVARAGSGPGEIRNANGMLSAPNGEIWVNDPANARFSVFSPAGAFLRQQTVATWGYGFLWDGMIDLRGALLEFFPVRKLGGGPSTSSIRRFTGARIDTLPRPGCANRGGRGEETYFQGRGARGSMINAQVPFLPQPRSVWDPRGFIWCTSQDRYEALQLRIEGGDTVRRIESNAPPVPVSKDERYARIEQLRSSFRKIGAVDPDFSRIPVVKPAIEQLDVDDSGRLWVRRASADTTHTAYDIWNEGGRLIATLQAPFRISTFWHPLFRGDVLYTVVRDEDEVPYVVRARMVRP